MIGKKIKIGIIRGLLYYKYIAMWEEFLKQLDCEILISPSTNKEILAKGISIAIDESCLPVKIFLGHVDYIKDKVDYVLIPRIESLVKDELVCSKFMGLPDMVRNSFDNVKIIDFSISIQEGSSAKYAFYKLGKKFTFNPFKIKTAYKKACQAQEKFEKRYPLLNEIHNKKSQLKIAFLGHPYNIFDDFIGLPIIKKLNELGVWIKVAEEVESELARKLSKEISKDLYWTYNKKILGAAQYYLNQGIDGLIFLVSFPCGPDSLAVEMAIQKIKNKVPIMILVMDELQAEAGIQTRLESFVDILKMQKGIDYVTS